jgi:ornithine cyclodeaminase/alanine dehydrogenase-like protein (mu-crystallin family)
MSDAILPAVALILREADVQAVIEIDDIIAAIEAAMKELGEGVAQNEPRRRVFAPGGLLNVMFASYPGGRCTGLKAYTIADGRVRFLVTLFGLDGSLEAFIEADFMGA